MEESSRQKLYKRIIGLTGNFYKSLLLILCGIMLLVLPILSRDAGITDDERLHLEHGDRIARFYFDGDRIAASNPFNAQGIWAIDENPYDYPRLMNVYGGFFDLVTSTIYRTVTHHFMGPYESKHMLSAIAGWGLLVLIAVFAYRLSGSWAAALLAFILAAVSPRFIGHSLNNPKDIPFALAFGLALYQILRALQEGFSLRWSRVAFLILTFIIAIDTRVGGVILIFFLMLFAGIYFAYSLMVDRQPLRSTVRPAVLIGVVSVASYFGASLFWPFALQDPLRNPIRCLNIFKYYTTLDSFELFEGHRIHYYEIPWYFIPKWFYLTFPPVVLVGLVLACVFAGVLLYRQPRRMMEYGLMLFAVAFPLLTIIINKSNIYDDCRHVYFMLVPLISLAGIGWYMLLRSVSDGRVLRPMLAVLFILLWQPFAFMLRSHPLEVMYFTPLAGGEQGAWQKYEMDYWGFSVRSALDWIDQTDSIQAQGRKTHVRIWYGEQLKVRYYAEKSRHLQYVLTDNTTTDWDYTILLPAESKQNADILLRWPPANTIHEIMLDGAPLCAIVRNPRIDLHQSTHATTDSSAAPAAAPAPAASTHLLTGLNLYEAKNYNGAAKEFKQAVKDNPGDSLAWNDLIAAYNNLEMYQDAVAAGEEALSHFPRYELLVNNVKLARTGAAGLQLTEQYLIALSYNYYTQEEYAACIRSSYQLLQRNPRSDLAYNNICASQNILGHYPEAKIAAEKGLAINPANQLLRNNLAVTLKALGQK